METDKRPLHSAQRLTVTEGLELRAVLSNEPVCPLAVVEADLNKAAPEPPRDYILKRLVRIRDNDGAPPGDGPYKMVELNLDRLKVREDVSVIVLEVVQDLDYRMVVDELGALVEERRVVLVGLDDEELPVALPSGDAEVLRHAAYKEAGLLPGLLQDPGDH